MKFDFDVAIIGYGPVGALLANLLGKAGLSVAIFEREEAINPLPRAVGFDGETMRIFQAAGLADEVARIARASYKPTQFVNEDGRVLLFFKRGMDGQEPHGWSNGWNVHQPFLEEVLRRGVERYGNIRVLTGHDVRTVEPANRGATVKAVEIASDRPVAFQARYVVGCDGARSLVRRLIGSTMEDLGLHQPWLVVDILINEGSERAKLLPDHSVQFCDPARPTTMVFVNPRRRRWEIMLMPGDDPATATAPDRLWSLLSRWIGPKDGAIERAAVYTFHSIIAEGWRQGPLFLAGDACHQTPPFLGQGMCAGMRDAMNLSWKLAMTVNGTADDSILDTYESERRPHVTEITRLAVKLGKVIQATDPAEVAERNRHYSGKEPVSFVIPRPQLGPGVRCDAPAPTGVVFPQPRLADDRRLDEATGGRFAVIGDAATLAGVDQETRRRWQDLDATMLADPGPQFAEWLAASGVAAVILRPDFYVFGTAEDSRRLAEISRQLPQRPDGPAQPTGFAQSDAGVPTMTASAK